MLSVMVILLSKINSCSILVAMAVFNPSRAPCRVLALKEKQCYSEHWINALLRCLRGKISQLRTDLVSQQMHVVRPRSVPDTNLLSTVESM